MSPLEKLIFAVLLSSNFVVSHPDENLSVTELIKKHGYPAEVHTYETEDGYILKAHRIPHGVSNQKSKEVVVLGHGLGGSGENFITLGPPDALAFYLADREYDVWLFNARGTVHSRKHRSLNPNTDRKKFWNFSWHEIAVFDLPATIDYILNTTGADKLYYIGHSQGTTILFVMLSELPDMNNKIKVAGLLSPSAYTWYTHSPILNIGSKFFGLGQRLLSMFNWHELMMPNSPMLNNIVLSLCKAEYMQDLCMDVVYLISGTESGLINKTLLPVLLQYSPTGCAVKQAWHYAQVIISEEFKQYDYGKKKNLRLYNNTKPPLYNFSNMKAPMALFYAKEDPFGNTRMVEEFMKTLPNVVLKYEVPVKDWGHIDFIMANNLKEVINDPMHKVFKQFEDFNDIL